MRAQSARFIFVRLGTLHSWAVAIVTFLALSSVQTENRESYREDALARARHMTGELLEAPLADRAGLLRGPTYHGPDLEERELVELPAELRTGTTPITTGPVPPDVRLAAEGGSGWALDWGTGGRKPRLSVSRAIDPDAVEEGFVRLTTPLDFIDSRVRGTKRRLLWAALFVGGFGLGICAFVSRTISRPLERAAEITRQIRDGNYTTSVPGLPTRELDTMAHGLNSLAREIQDRIASGARGRRNLETILESIVDGVIAVDDDDHILLLNASAGRMLDISGSRCEGQPIAAVARSRGLIEALREVVRTGRAITRELELRNPEHEMSIQLQVAPLKDSITHVTGAVAVLHDFTGQKRLENMRRDFVANVSHELKTPLTAIKGAAETILDDAAMPPDVVHRFVEKINDNSDRLSSLISDVLELSRLQSGDHALRYERVDLRGIARQAMSRIEASAKAGELDLDLVLADEEVAIRGDASALISVIENLLSNAIRYTPAGGHVRLTVARVGKSAELSVADTGIGIEPQHLDRIFERFYRVDAARSRAVGGTGLGLAIVKNSVHAHKGQVEVESEKGVGSTFRIRVPLCD